MKLSYTWLKQYIKVKQTPEQLAETLTLAGMEVESIERVGIGLEKIVVGQIKTMVDHEEADRLIVCKIDVGKGKMLTVVCGAFNIKAGDKVPVALVGTMLPNGMKIEQRRIRGVDSQGMLCAEDELGLGNDHAGIMILDPTMKVGQKLGVALHMPDIVFDVALPPNRADWFSVLGVSRELSALTNQKLQVERYEMTESKKFHARKAITVRVNERLLCPTYVARVVRNVKVRHSPAWLKARLIAVGIRPINTIVDVTNYVMLELGQPLHAFDLAKIEGKKILIRRARSKERITLLNGSDQTLDSSMLIIADAKKPLAVAGVMGGRAAEVTAKTRDVVLESAIFKPLTIRKTRQKLGIVTEASTRFEKGIWQSLPQQAADRAAALLAKLGRGEVAKGLISIESKKPSPPKQLRASVGSMNALLGTRWTSKQFGAAFTALRFHMKEAGEDVMNVQPPVWRSDIQTEEDLAEEAGRIYGWNNLTPKILHGNLKPQPLAHEKQSERHIKDALVACGLVETLHYSFYGMSLANQFGLDSSKHYRVQNPLNPSQQLLRTTLLPHLLENVLKNYQEQDSMQLFEIGHVYLPASGMLPDERAKIGLMAYHKKHNALKILKNALNQFFSFVHIPLESVRYAVSQKNPGAGDIFIAKLRSSNERVGTFHEVFAGQEKLGSTPAYAELDLPSLIRHMLTPKYKPLPQYPSVTRDLSIIIGPDQEYHVLSDRLRSFHEFLVVVHPVDLFPLKDGRRSITLRLEFRSAARTLTSGEVDLLLARLIKDIERIFRAEIRQ